MATAYVALGSNVGNRADNLRRACRLLERNGALCIAARSRIYETQSVEGGGPDDFLNACVRVETNLSPLQLLHHLRAVEEEMGRPQPPRHGPRLIDLDILLYENEAVDTPELTIPHPRMMRRAFVLRPLCDVLESGWLHETNFEF